MEIKIKHNILMLTVVYCLNAVTIISETVHKIWVQCNFNGWGTLINYFVERKCRLIFDFQLIIK